LGIAFKNIIRNSSRNELPTYKSATYNSQRFEISKVRHIKSSILLTEKIERPTDNTKIKISDFGLSKIIKQFDEQGEQMTGQLGTCV
jgi:hypothetical protein